WTDFDIVQQHRSPQNPVHLIERFPANLSARDTRLVGRENRQESRLANARHRLGNSLDNRKVFQRERTVGVVCKRSGAHEHAVAVEKHGPALHSFTILRSSELWRQASITRKQARESAADPLNSSPQRMARSIASHCASQ